MVGIVILALIKPRWSIRRLIRFKLPGICIIIGRGHRNAMHPGQNPSQWPGACACLVLPANTICAVLARLPAAASLQLPNTAAVSLGAAATMNCLL